MALKYRDRQIVIQPGLYILIAAFLLVLPMYWVIGWFVAVIFHEFCHYIALRLCNVPIFGISIGSFGANILTGHMTESQEIFSALAGPAGSLVLLAFIQIFPYISLCAFAQTAFNLLPVFPMDGGRVLTGICIKLLGSEKGNRLGKLISNIFLAILALLTVYITLRYKLGIIPILLAGYIFVRVSKFPCKEGKLIVQ